MILEQFVKVDVVGLLKKITYFESLIKSWNEQLAEMPEISAVRYDGVGGSSGIGDRTANLAIKRGDIELKRDAYMRELSTINRSLSLLASDEKTILDMLYIHPKNIAFICEEMCLEKSRIYDIANSAIKKLEEMLF